MFAARGACVSDSSVGEIGVDEGTGLFVAHAFTNNITRIWEIVFFIDFSTKYYYPATKMWEPLHLKQTPEWMLDMPNGHDTVSIGGFQLKINRNQRPYQTIVVD